MEPGQWHWPDIRPDPGRQWPVTRTDRVFWTRTYEPRGMRRCDALSCIRHIRFLLRSRVKKPGQGFDPWPDPTWTQIADSVTRWPVTRRPGSISDMMITLLHSECLVKEFRQSANNEVMTKTWWLTFLDHCVHVRHSPCSSHISELVLSQLKSLAASVGSSCGVFVPSATEELTSIAYYAPWSMLSGTSDTFKLYLDTF